MPDLHQRPRCRHEAGAVAPGEPHLLAGRVEGDRQPGHDPVAGADRPVLQEHPRLGVDEGGGAAMAHRDALGRAGGPGREDDPGVVGEVGVLLGGRLGDDLGREDDEVGGDDRGHAGLVEDQAGALVGVVVVDGDVGGAGEQDADDRDVEVGRARRDAHPHPVAAADALVAQGGGDLAGGREQLVVGEHLAAVVDRRRVGVVVSGGAQDVDEGAGRGGAVGAQQGVGADRKVGARSGELHGAHDGGPAVDGSGRPAQQATAPGVDQAHEDDADEDDHLDEGGDAEVRVADHQGPREEVDRVDGEHDVEEGEGDVPDLALRPAHPDRVDARLVGAQPLLGDRAGGDQAAGDHRGRDEEDAGQHDRRCRCVTLHASQRSHNVASGRRRSPAWGSVCVVGPASGLPAVRPMASGR